MPTAAWGWDESTVPFPEYVERQVGQSRRYLARLSAELGRAVRPRLSLGWLVLRATRLPFLSATFVPVLIGIAIAALHGSFDLAAAMLTVIGANAVHLALNVANDVFDARLGADEQNVNPTKFSGGSRVIQYGLVSLRRMARDLRGPLRRRHRRSGCTCWRRVSRSPLLVIGVAGILLSLFYTAPPLKLVYRGLGELTTAIGFGPLMLVGAYVVQTRRRAVGRALRRVDPDRAAGGADPVRQRGSGPPGRRARRQANAARAAGRASRDQRLRDLRPWPRSRSSPSGVLGGLLPIPTLIALLPLPLVGRVRHGLTTTTTSRTASWRSWTSTSASTCTSACCSSRHTW